MSELDAKVHDLTDIEWTSGVSGTREGYPPFITLRVAAKDGHVVVGQMELTEAQDVMHNLLSVIEAADMDSALMRFAIEVLKMDEEQAGFMIGHLRHYRESLK